MLFTCVLSDFNLLTDDGPLTESERRELLRKRTDVQSNLYLDSLLDPLIASGCISSRHREDIEHAGTNINMIGRLLDIMARRSFAQYLIFIQTLCVTKQEFVANIL